jgi:DNA (cytosine-5)-methyltransferase 1
VKKRVLSLFSGCGGMDVGFEGGFLAHKKSIVASETIDEKYVSLNRNYIMLKDLDYTIVFANDILRSAQSAWVHYFKRRNPDSEKIFLRNSIVDIVSDYRKQWYDFPKHIDIVTGGFPCQDFSVSGKRLGFKSHKNHLGLLSEESSEVSRGQLYLWMKEVVSITKPKMFIAENVKGLVSMGSVKRVIENDFREIDQGYLVLEAKVLNVKNFGVPQNRERVIFVGVSLRYANPQSIGELLKYGDKSDLYPYPKPTHGDRNPLVTLNDVFAGLPEPEESSDSSHRAYSKAKYYGKVQGGSEIDLYGQGPTIRAEHHGNIEYRRLSKENGGRIKEEYHLPQRRLSVRECGLIQSFPPDYEFVFDDMRGKVSASDAYKLIGNAVPPLFAYAFASHINSIWEGMFS